MPPRRLTRDPGAPDASKLDRLSRVSGAASDRRGIALYLAAAVAAGGLLHGQVRSPITVLWVWSGAVTATSAVVKAKVRGADAGVELLIDTDPRFSQASRLPLDGERRPSESGVVTFAPAGLQPASRYYYAVASGNQRSVAGELRTFAAGPMSFEFATASCAGGNMFSSVSNHRIFATIENRGPLLFLHMGDFHYLNIDRADVRLFRRAYDLVLGQPRQASLYRKAPIVYMWDDHDFGPNDSDRTSPARGAARNAYAENVPHYPLVGESEDVSTIQQEFTVGRVRFIVSDLRSERDPPAKKDGADKTLLGLRQREWLAEAFGRAATDGSPLIVWVSSVPWITRQGNPEEGWEPYSWERRLVADRIAALGLTNRILMISGDAHMTAIDDGTNSYYASDATPGRRGFPILQAGPLDRSPTVKGGPYSHGLSRRNNQFGWVEVRDSGDELRVAVSGHDRNGRQIPGMRLQLTCRAGTCR
jgi:alkaline phosphatase D